MYLRYISTNSGYEKKMETNTRCSGCGHKIYEEEKYIVLSGELYHEECSSEIDLADVLKKSYGTQFETTWNE